MSKAAIHSYRRYLRNRFGAPVLRIPVNAGLTCPNRDGSKGKDGCLFCDNRSFSPASEATSNPTEQIRSALLRSAGRYRFFIPYLQPFSNTYAQADRLRSIYEPLLAIPGVVGLAVGTRPDCFLPGVLEYLQDLSRRTYLCIELGLQSWHNATLDRINRGHTREVFVDVVHELFRRGIEVVAHVILGLPGETREMMCATADGLASLPVKGIKVHQLMILEGTALEQWYREGVLSAPGLEWYADILADFLLRLRPDQYVHRLMADSRVDRGLVAPLWSARKPASLTRIHALLSDRGVVQGSLWRSCNGMPTGQIPPG